MNFLKKAKQKLFSKKHGLKFSQKTDLLLKALNSMYGLASQYRRHQDPCMFLNSMQDELTGSRSGSKALDYTLKSIYGLASLTQEAKRPPSLFLNYLEGVRRIVQSKSFLEGGEEGEQLITALGDFSSKEQWRSKLYLVDTLKNKGVLELGTVCLCAGWWGLIPFLLLNDKNFSIKKIFNFELDPLSVEFSKALNHKFVAQGRFNAFQKNILQVSESEKEKKAFSPDTYINTSCEHISKEDFSTWWKTLPADKLLILQSNNFFGVKGHINCLPSLEEFKKQAPLDSILYEGELDLKLYKRFMLIGYKRPTK